MTTTALIPPPPAASAPPSFAEILRETVPLVGVIPVAGPPVVLLAVPWLLLALVLVGYVALLLTVAALLVGAAAAVRLIGGLVRAAYCFARDVQRHRPGRLGLRAPAVAGQPR